VAVQVPEAAETLRRVRACYLDLRSRSATAGGAEDARALVSEIMTGVETGQLKWLFIDLGGRPDLARDFSEVFFGALGRSLNWDWFRAHVVLMTHNERLKTELKGITRSAHEEVAGPIKGDGQRRSLSRWGLVGAGCAAVSLFAYLAASGTLVEMVESALPNAKDHCRQYAQSVKDRAGQCAEKGYHPSDQWVEKSDGKLPAESACLVSTINSAMKKNWNRLILCQDRIQSTDCSTFDDAPWLDEGSPCVGGEEPPF